MPVDNPASEQSNVEQSYVNAARREDWSRAYLILARLKSGRVVRFGITYSSACLKINSVTTVYTLLLGAVIRAT